MAVIKTVSNTFEMIGAHSAGLGGVVHSVKPPDSVIANLSSTDYLNDAGVPIWEASDRISYKVNEYIENTVVETVVKGDFTIGVRPLTTINTILTANPLMENYIMAHPLMYEAHQNSIDVFKGWEQENYALGDDNVYHRRVYDGILQEEDGYFVSHHYIDDDIDVEVLSFKEQLAVLETYLTIDNLTSNDLDIQALIDEEVIYY